MKNLLIIVFLFALSLSVSSQTSWEQITYHHLSGPVSPEYQFSYNILINSDGDGVLEYTFKGFTTNYDFNVSSKGINNLNSAILKSQVLDVSKEELSSDKNLIGGSLSNATITLNNNQNDTNSKITIPNFVNEKYAEGVSDLYLVIEKLVPNSAWSKATDNAE
ncbi:MAG: hypothetical protein WAT71_04965 [Ignavibacteria bacterium]